MKVLAPTRLLAEAAEVLEPAHDEVVVVGAAALEVALADAATVAITPTREVDVVVPAARAAAHAEHEVRRRAADAISQLAAGEDATAAAARQMIRLPTATSQRTAEAAVRRAALRIQQHRADTAGWTSPSK